MTDESEQRYRTLVETSPAPINLFDATGEIIWGNDAVLDLLGLDSRADLVGRSIFEFVHPEDRYTAERELLTVVEEMTATGPTSMTLHRADGETRDVRVSTAPGRYDGRAIGQAVVVDVTPLRELRAEREIERAFFENALDALRDVFYVVDTDGLLLRWNDALCDVSGYEAGELQGMYAEDLFVEGDTDRVSETISRAFDAGEAVVEASVRTKSGKEIPFEFRKRRLDIDGEFHGLVAIGRDISDRLARDRHLRAVDRLFQHTLRNKLNVILGSSSHLRESDERPPETAIDRIDAAAERMLSMFEHHQYIVECLTGRESAVEFELDRLVDRVVEQGRETYPEAELSVDVPGGIVARAVPEFERALFELVENAIVHNDDSAPAVRVAVDAPGPWVRIRVIDDGPTIPEMERQTVTGVAETEPTFHSQGLGLWFVHWVVEQSDGSLSFAERDPGGNVVVVELPQGSAA